MMECRASIAASVSCRMLSADIADNLSQRAHRLDCYLVGRAGRAQPENSGYPETSRIGAAIDPCSDIEEHARHLQMLASEVVLNKRSFGRYAGYERKKRRVKKKRFNDIQLEHEVATTCRRSEAQSW